MRLFAFFANARRFTFCTLIMQLCVCPLCDPFVRFRTPLFRFFSVFDEGAEPTTYMQVTSPNWPSTRLSRRNLRPLWENVTRNRIYYVCWYCWSIQASLKCSKISIELEFISINSVLNQQSDSQIDRRLESCNRGIYALREASVSWYIDFVRWKKRSIGMQKKAFERFRFADVK